MAKQKYDERQMMVRRKGYTFGYVATIVLLAISGYASLLLPNPLFVDQLTMAVTIIAIPSIFVIGYFILKDAYYQDNDPKGRLLFLVLFGILGFLWLAILFQGKFDELWVNHQIGRDILNVVMSLLYLTIFGTSLYKVIEDRQNYPFTKFFNRRTLLLLVGLVALLAISSWLNLPKGERLSNLLSNYLLPLSFILAGSFLVSQVQKSWQKVLSWLLLGLGAFWFGYICLYYLIGFHNHYWL